MQALVPRKHTRPEEDLIALVVAGVHERHRTAGHVERQDGPIELERSSWNGENRDLICYALSSFTAFELDGDKSARSKIQGAGLFGCKCRLAHANERRARRNNYRQHFAGSRSANGQLAVTGVVMQYATFVIALG